MDPQSRCSGLDLVGTFQQHWHWQVPLPVRGHWQHGLAGPGPGHGTTTASVMRHGMTVTRARAVTVMPYQVAPHRQRPESSLCCSPPGSGSLGMLVSGTVGFSSTFESPRRTGRLGPLRLSRTVTVTGRVTRTRAQAAAAGGTVRLKKKPAEGRPYTRPAGAARPRHST